MSTGKAEPTLDDLVLADEIPHDTLTNETIAWFDAYGGCVTMDALRPGTIAMIVADLLKARGYTITAPAASDGATGAEGDGR